VREVQQLFYSHREVQKPFFMGKCNIHLMKTDFEVAFTDPVSFV
jgi:hypothetical protein